MRSEHTWTDTHRARRALFEAEVRAALRSEPRLGPSFHLKALGIEPDGSLIPEVPTIAAKKMALEKDWFDRVVSELPVKGKVE